MPLRILLSRIRIQELLHLRHPGVRLRAESQLDLHQRFKAWIEVGHTEIDELREFGEELLVECFVSGFGKIGLALGAGQLRGIFVGLFHELLHFGPRGVVVEEFVVTLFDA